MKIILLIAIAEILLLGAMFVPSKYEQDEVDVWINQMIGELLCEK